MNGWGYGKEIKFVVLKDTLEVNAHYMLKEKLRNELSEKTILDIQYNKIYLAPGVFTSKYDYLFTITIFYKD